VLVDLDVPEAKRAAAQIAAVAGSVNLAVAASPVAVEVSSAAQHAAVADFADFLAVAAVLAGIAAVELVLARLAAAAVVAAVELVVAQLVVAAVAVADVSAAAIVAVVGHTGCLVKDYAGALAFAAGLPDDVDRAAAAAAAVAAAAVTVVAVVAAAAAVDGGAAVLAADVVEVEGTVVPAYSAVADTVGFEVRTDRVAFGFVGGLASHLIDSFAFDDASYSSFDAVKQPVFHQRRT